MVCPSAAGECQMKHASSGRGMQQSLSASPPGSPSLSSQSGMEWSSWSRTLFSLSGVAMGRMRNGCVPTGLVCVYNDVTENRYGDVGRLLNGRLFVFVASPLTNSTVLEGSFVRLSLYCPVSPVSNRIESNQIESNRIEGAFPRAFPLDSVTSTENGKPGSV